MLIYLAFLFCRTVTYGALAAIVITLLFLYFSDEIIIFGAEFNAAWRQHQERQD